MPTHLVAALQAMKEQHGGHLVDGLRTMKTQHGGHLVAALQTLKINLIRRDPVEVLATAIEVEPKGNR